MLTDSTSQRLRRMVAGAVITYSTALVLGTHWPKLPEFGPEGSDKFAHFIAYAGLAFLFTLSLLWDKKSAWWKWSLILLGLALFGAADELTQPSFERSADRYDWYADLAGITTGLLLALAANRLLLRHHTPDIQTTNHLDTRAFIP